MFVMESSVRKSECGMNAKSAVFVGRTRTVRTFVKNVS